MNFPAKVITKSAKEHKCLMCLQVIPKGNIYIVIPHKDDTDGKFEAVKMCPECAYLMNNTTNNKFKEGNFTDTNIPNFLRKIRNEYRKDPQKAWEKFENE
jgi:hypothetical protein